MSGTIINTHIAGLLKIASLDDPIGQGVHGVVYLTDNPVYLIKVWRPEKDRVNNYEYEVEREEAKRRYRTFSQLDFGTDRELACLPREFVEVNGSPGYVMQRAVGKEMREAWADLLELGLEQRLRIARSVANAVSFLHSRQVVHADIKGDNFFFDPPSSSAQILDVDGGGYWGAERELHCFPPTARYGEGGLPPELNWYSWQKQYRDRPWEPIWRNDNMRRQPDYWALAILVYRIIVGERPFSGEAAFKAFPDWPAEEQKTKFKRLRIDRGLIEYFTYTFCAQNRPKIDPSRYPADAWRGCLDAAIANYPRTSDRCPRCNYVDEDLSEMVCQRCTKWHPDLPPSPLWGWTTCPRGHRTPAKSLYYPYRPAYCFHSGCGEEIDPND